MEIRARYWAALVVTALFAWSASADAQTGPVTFEWINPTGCADGIDCLMFNNYQVGCGPAVGDRASVVRSWIDDGTTVRTFNDFTAGVDHFCAMRVDCIGTPSNACSFSDWSNEVFFLLPVPTRPGPPTGLTVVIGSGS